MSGLAADQQQFDQQFQTHFSQTKPPRLILKYTNLLCSRADLLDAAAPDQSVLYNVEFHTFKPQLVLTVPGEALAFATGTQHTLSTKIEFDIRGESIEMRPTSKWTQSTYTYSSPAAQQRTLTWKSHHGWTNGNMTCLDNDMVVAELKINNFSWKKGAELDFVGLASEDSRYREEVLTTGLMMILLYAQKVAAANSSASASAASAATAAATA